MPILNPLSRKYAALVVSIDDPRKMGRVRVRIDGLHDDITDEFLPWAIPAEMSQGHGSLDLPTVGHRILVQMQDREASEYCISGIFSIRISVTCSEYRMRCKRIIRTVRDWWDRYGNYMYRDQKDGKYCHGYCQWR